jgi:hypothetical protein
MADWYPNSRDEQLRMIKTWNAVFASKGQEWGIPPAHITQLTTDVQVADAILQRGPKHIKQISRKKMG